MYARGGVIFNDDGSVYEGPVTFGAPVTQEEVLTALGADTAEAGDVLTADGAGGAAFAAPAS